MNDKLKNINVVKLKNVIIMRRGETILPMCRKRFWFWDSIVLLQTLALAASQVFATSLDAYFQVTIMLMVLVIGITVLAHCQPFEERLS